MGRGVVPATERVFRREPILSGDCWLWPGKCWTNGYGQITQTVDGKVKYLLVHRVAYEATHGAIPDGQMVRHSCDTPACYNPAHLLVGTAQDNSNDMKERKRQIKPQNDRTHCKNGHAFTEENKFERPSATGGVRFHCRECQRESVRAYQERKTGKPYLGQVHNRDKTACKRGHEFVEGSYYINPTSGGRQCKACLRLRRQGATT